MPVIEPLWNEDAEDHVLSCMMQSEKALDTCADILEPEAFYRPSNGVIFSAILGAREKGRPPDALVTAAYLDASGELKDVGGPERIGELAIHAPAVSNAAHYAKIVRAKYILRELVSAGHDIQQLGHGGTGDLDEIVAEADKRMLAVSNKLERKKNSVYNSKQLVEEFRERMARPEDLREGVPTPFPTFLRPLKGGRLYVLGGYQADGKSVIAVQFLKAACEAGKRVGFASIEMSRADLVDRLVATFGVPHAQIIEGDISAYTDIVEMALAEIATWDFEIIDDEALDPGAIRRYQRTGKYDLLIVDHLHRIQIKDKRHEREEIGESVRRFTNIAREFDVPVLLLSQLSRGQKHDPYPRPTMADVRGTSAIESEAAMVLFVYRLREKNERTNEAELLVAKNRYGGEGFLNLRFSPQFVRFAAVSGHQTGGST